MFSVVALRRTSSAIAELGGGAIKHYRTSGGGPKPTRVIYLRDKGRQRLCVQHIHKNLWRFLDTVRRHRMFNDLVWADSLCLNQQDKDEIAHQVPRMGQIYSNAEQVIIWLGNERKRESALSRLLYLDDSFHWDMMCEVDHLLQLPYWSRVWIVQEVLKLSWQEMRSLCMETSRLIRQTSTARSLGLRMMRSKTTTSHSGSSTGCEKRAGRGHCGGYILYEFSNCESALELDKVYGLFGLVSHSEDIRLYGFSPVDLIRVDYKEPAFDLFFNTVFEMRVTTV